MSTPTMPETALIVKGEIVEAGPGEALERAAEAVPFSGYSGVATLALAPDKVEILTSPFHQDEGAEAYDILPTGEVYVSQIHYRRRLNRAFGPGSWAMVPRGGYIQQGNTLCREYALVVDGRFIAEAIGESDYQPNNARMSYASCAEAVKSNALTRTCKDIGIASECWDKRFCQKFQAEHCVRVWRESEKKPQWRRIDATPWWDEKGEVKDRAMPPQHREPGSDDGIVMETSVGPVTVGSGQHAQAAGAQKAVAPSGPTAPCPKCKKPAPSSKYPAAGKTHYCYACRYAFDPTVPTGAKAK